jgi:hypothetical protein
MVAGPFREIDGGHVVGERVRRMPDGAEDRQHGSACTVRPEGLTFERLKAWSLAASRCSKGCCAARRAVWRHADPERLDDDGSRRYVEFTRVRDTPVSHQ